MKSPEHMFPLVEKKPLKGIQLFIHLASTQVRKTGLINKGCASKHNKVCLQDS